MPTLTITKSYANNTVLTESQLDDIKTSIEQFINTTKLGADNLQNDSVGSAQVANAAVLTTKIANNAVTDSKLSSSPLSDVDRAVGSDHIKSNAVVTSKILDSNVTTDKIADAAVTQAKRAPLGEQISPSSGAYSFNNVASYVDITNLSVSITTTGRPVMVGLIPAAYDDFLAANINVNVGGFQLRYTVDSTPLANFVVTGQGYKPLGQFFTVLTGISSGLHTIKAQARSPSANTEIYNLKLIAFEL